MKKIAKLLSLTLALILCMTACAGATVLSTTYYIEELNLAVTVPTGYHVFDRNVQADHPVLGLLGKSAEDLSSFLKNNDMYFDVLHPEIKHEMTIAMAENTIDNFNNYGDNVLQQVANQIPSIYANQGMTVSKTELYKNDEASFIKIFYQDPGATSYVLQYYTVYDYRAINFRLYDFVGEITAEDEALLLNLVNSADFAYR